MSQVTEETDTEIQQMAVFAHAARSYVVWMQYAATSAISQDPYEGYDASWECTHGKVPGEGCEQGCHKQGRR